MLGSVALLLCVIFLGVAAVGWMREKRDVRIIRARFQEQEAEIRSAIAEIGEGIPLEAFKELFPYARYDKEDEEWTVY